MCNISYKDIFLFITYLLSFVNNQVGSESFPYLKVDRSVNRCRMMNTSDVSSRCSRLELKVDAEICALQSHSQSSMPTGANSGRWEWPTNSSRATQVQTWTSCRAIREIYFYVCRWYQPKFEGLSQQTGTCLITCQNQTTQNWICRVAETREQ